MNDIQNEVIRSFQSRNYIEGLTHNFYRYPARFAPDFAREVILKFSREGDCVLDAFMGGGTTIVEAIATGRLAFGIDINPLAHFISLVKTTPLSPRDREAVLGWTGSAILDENVNSEYSTTPDPRLKNVPEEVKLFLMCAASRIEQLEFPRQRRFARCALLRLGQWAIDCRRSIPSVSSMQTQLAKQASEMLRGLDELAKAARNQGVPKNRIVGRRMLLLGSVCDAIESQRSIGSFPRAKLVLTSPPYPGVHVLYHRWQIRGRRETPVPYWLANLKDGHGESFYTLGGRSKKGLGNYFARLTEIFRHLRQFIDPEGLVIQLVAFSDPDAQLPAFLNAMTLAGYEEMTPFDTISQRPCRKVPNRKWYTQLGQNQYASNEILLFHRPIE